MKNNSAGKQRHYEIEIEGHLDDHWQEWFEDFSMIQLENGRFYPRRQSRISRHGNERLEN